MAELTVVMPAYNEAGNIAAAVAEVAGQVLDAVPGSELLVVNDGSRDATGEILAGLAAAEPRLKVLTQPNGGHGAALMAGMDAAAGRYLLLLDSDRQIALDRFAAHWAMLAGTDAVVGCRATRHDPRHRLVISAAMRLLLRLLFGRAPRDANIPYKLVPAAAWQQAKAAIGPRCLIPSALLGVWLLRSGLRVAEVEIEHRPRIAGVTVLRAGRLARFCWRALGDVIRFRRRL